MCSLQLLSGVVRKASRWVAVIVPAAILVACTGSPMPPPFPLGAGIVSGRQQCVVTPNGAPDCSAAVNALCRGKGFEAGTNLNTQSELCLEGSRAVGTCVFVTRAACH